jgi:hypothetical protein
MRFKRDTEPAALDIFRGLIASASSIGIVVLLFGARTDRFMLKLLSAAAIATFCISTAKSKAGVALGVIVVIISRVLIGGTLYLLKP